jgi:hypothetical protein
MTGGGAIRALHHVQLAAPAGSEAALREFYSGVLGMAELAKPAELARRGGVWFGSGEVELHLGIEADFRPARKAHPGLLVSELDALAGRLMAAGHPVTWDDALPVAAAATWPTRSATGWSCSSRLADPPRRGLPAASADGRSARLASSAGSPRPEPITAQPVTVPGAS